MREPGPDGRVVVLCKGADNVIFDRSVGKDPRSYPRLVAQLGAFARTGLRTLVLAQRYLSEEEARAWSEQYVLFFSFLIREPLQAFAPRC